MQAFVSGCLPRILSFSGIFVFLLGSYCYRVMAPVSVELPDLDGDGKADSVIVSHLYPAIFRESVSFKAATVSSRNLCRVRGEFPWCVTGTRPYWRVMDSQGNTLVHVRLIEQGSRPDLVVYGEHLWRQTDGRQQGDLTQSYGFRLRYVGADGSKGDAADRKLLRALPEKGDLGNIWSSDHQVFEDGFIRMFSDTAIPGYSVGLVRVGDDAKTMGILGDRAVTSGPWHPVVPKDLTLHLTPDAEGHVASATYDKHPHLQPIELRIP